MLLTPCAPTPPLFLSSIYTEDDISRDHLHDRRFATSNFPISKTWKWENDFSYIFFSIAFELDMIILDDNHFYVIDPLETLTRLYNFEFENLKLFGKLADFYKRKDI